MRFVRFCILIVSVLTAYAAQFIFDNRSLVDFFPDWLRQYFPFALQSTLFQTSQWQPNDLINLGLILLALSSIGFGLICNQWIGEYSYYLLGREPDVVIEPTVDRRRLAGTWFGIGAGLLAVAGCLVAYVAGTILAGNGESAGRQLAWIGAVLLFLLGSLLLDRGISLRRPFSRMRVTTRRLLRPVNPLQSWPTLLVILAVAGLLYSWNPESMPALVDESTAQIGLQALEIARGNTNELFAPGVTGSPLLTYLPAAVAMRVTGDPLLGMRFSGLLTGLLTVLATWLLGTELFRRTPRLGAFQIPIEDDGRWIASVATALIAFSYVILHFSRGPIYLAPVAWGTFGLWAMLRGLRTGDWFALALSGALIGWSSILYAGGLLYLIITPIWWIGVWLLRREWLFNRGFGVGAPGFLLWLGSMLVTIAPILAVWRVNSEAFANFTQNDIILNSLTQARLEILYSTGGFDTVFWENLKLTLLTFNIYPNAGAHFALVHPFLNSIVAPIFALAIGALLLNLDRLPGWLLLSALGGGIILSAVNPNAPFWARLLPLLPIAALAMAFALDRARLTLVETGGTALGQTAVYLVIGVVVWSSVNSWLLYYGHAHGNGDGVSYTGRAIREMEEGETALLVVNNPRSRIRSGDPVLTFFASKPNDGDAEMVGSEEERQPRLMEIVPPAWPTPSELPPNGKLLLQPEDSALLEEIDRLYLDTVCGGVTNAGCDQESRLTRVRDRRGNPVLLVYDLSKGS